MKDNGNRIMTNRSRSKSQNQNNNNNYNDNKSNRSNKNSIMQKSQTKNRYLNIDKNNNK